MARIKDRALLAAWTAFWEGLPTNTVVELRVAMSQVEALSSWLSCFGAHQVRIVLVLDEEKAIKKRQGKWIARCAQLEKAPLSDDEALPRHAPAATVPPRQKRR